MAILSDLHGIDVSLHSQGAFLKEYPDLDTPLIIDNYENPSQGKTSLKYVEVTADSEFSIRCSISGWFDANYDVSFTAEVDGIRVASLIAENDTINTGSWYGNITALCQRINEYQVANRPLQFSGLTTVDRGDADEIRRDAKAIRRIGEVLIYVHRTLRDGHEAVGNTIKPRAIREVSEKSLKGQAISHSVTYGAEKIIERAPTAGVVFLDDFFKPLAIFRFKYRSKKALQAMLIIPRSPTPEPVHLPAPTKVKEQNSISNASLNTINIPPVNWTAHYGSPSEMSSEYHPSMPAMNDVGPHSDMIRASRDSRQDNFTYQNPMSPGRPGSQTGGIKRSTDNNDSSLTKRQKLEFLQRQLEQVKSEVDDETTANLKREREETLQAESQYRTISRNDGSVVIDLTDD